MHVIINLGKPAVPKQDFTESNLTQEGKWNLLKFRIFLADIHF